MTPPRADLRPAARALRADSAHVDHEIELLVLGEPRPLPLARDVPLDLLDAGHHVRVLTLDSAKPLDDRAVERRAGVQALEQVAHVRGVARVRERRAVDADAEAVLDDLRHVLEHVLVRAQALDLLRARRHDARRHDVHGDGRGLVVSQRHPEPAAHATHDVLRQAVLVRVGLLDVEGKRHTYLNALLGTLDGERDVIRQGEGEVGAELVGELVSDVVNLREGEVQHVGRDVVDGGDVASVHVVERSLDLAEPNLARELAEADAPTHGEHLVAPVVDAYGHVVVNSANCPHALPFSSPWCRAPMCPYDRSGHEKTPRCTPNLTGRLPAGLVMPQGVTFHRSYAFVSTDAVMPLAGYIPLTILSRQAAAPRPASPNGRIPSMDGFIGLLPGHAALLNSTALSHAACATEWERGLIMPRSCFDETGLYLTLCVAHALCTRAAVLIASCAPRRAPNERCVLEVECTTRIGQG